MQAFVEVIARHHELEGHAVSALLSCAVEALHDLVRVVRVGRLGHRQLFATLLLSELELEVVVADVQVLHDVILLALVDDVVYILGYVAAALRKLEEVKALMELLSEVGREHARVSGVKVADVLDNFEAVFMRLAVKSPIKLAEEVLHRLFAERDWRAHRQVNSSVVWVLSSLVMEGSSL